VPEGCRISDNWRALLAEDELDGVIVATPPGTHAAIVTAAVQAELPVLVEKPLTANLSETIELNQLISSSGVPVLVDHSQLFHPAYRQLKQTASTLGPVLGICSAGGQLRSPNHEVAPLWDYGPHDVALSLDFMGQAPIGVRLLERSSLEVDRAAGEVWSFQLEFPGKVLSSITVGNAMTEKKRCFAVQFQARTLVFDDLAEDKLVNYGGNQWPDAKARGLTRQLTKEGGQPIAVDPALPLTRVVEEFISGIREPYNLPPSFGTDLAVEVAKVLSALEDSLPLDNPVGD
jgi:predicted dehydrogenase